MSPLHRLPSAELTSRAPGKIINFRFDGKAYQGMEGDTLASALMANGVRVIGRSFKLHRPRGLMGSWLEESNGLVQLESGGYDEPNARATLIPLYEGLSARSQNAWPSVEVDLLGALDFFQRMLPASFYYKSMMWPSWHFFERFVRPIAGLGKSPEAKDAQNYQKRNLHCELLICGGGPAGISAALESAKNGKRIVVIDDREEFGGSLLGETHTIDGQPAHEWVRSSIDTLKQFPNVMLLPRTSVSGYYEHNFVAAAERVTNHLGPQAGSSALPRERLWRIRAKSVILATGAIERPLVFPNNDRPGVMLASAVGYYATRFGVVPGQQVVFATNNDSVYRVALDLKRAGISSVSVVDTRKTIPASLLRRINEAGVDLYLAESIRNVKGRAFVKSVLISPHLGDGQLDAQTRELPCDLLAVSSGWTPTLHLLSQSGGSLKFDKSLVCLVPDKITQHLVVVGAAAGQFTLQECLEAGACAGRATLDCTDHAEHAGDRSTSRLDVNEGFSIEPFWFTKSGPTDKQWLDFQYDVKVSDIEIAIRENFVSVEHVKRYTTGGMSVDQGKSSNFNILAIIGEITGRPIPEVGTTRFRPPFQPVSIGTFAGATTGELYAARSRLPAEEWHSKRNATYGDYGWLRPDFYAVGTEDVHAATTREVNTVRTGVGLFDGSPLGKIEVSGPDAGTFLDRMYVNNIASLKVGAARYALMSNENGILIDDGVLVRLADERYLVHATSAAVGRIALLFEEYLQCEWPDLKVFINNVTTQYANVTVTGPKARSVMQKLDSDINFNADQFKHMNFRDGIVEGVPVRILRASFTGEVTFEVSFPARYAMSMWECIATAGEEFGLIPYGIEAIEVMRTEKGYIHIGTDTDGTTNALDIGFGGIISRKSTDFIGRRSIQREADMDSSRLQFVGLEPIEPTEKLAVGGHVITTDQPVIPVSSHGYVTSSCYSPTLNKHIALGIVRAGASRIDERVFVYSNGRITAAKIVSPTHLDPKGERLNG